MVTISRFTLVLWLPILQGFADLSILRLLRNLGETDDPIVAFAVLMRASSGSQHHEGNN